MTFRQRLVLLAPIAVAVGLLAQRSIAAVLASCGHAAAPLDDAYIHFQYARAIAEGHPLRFQAGEPVTSGATSMLWPLLLAPCWALGARDDSIVWAAWVLSYVALGALAWEAGRLTEKLAGRAAAMGAAAMVVAFGGFAWCAASGMEVVPFAWVIARASRRASEWAEADDRQRTGRRAIELVFLAWSAALFRPEGSLWAIFLAATLAAFPRRRSWRGRCYGLAALAAAFALPFLLWMLTGDARSNTAVAKLLPGNPYYAGRALYAAVQANARQLVGELLDGGHFSAEFVPHHGAPVAMAGLGAIGALGWRTSRWRVIATLLLALAMFAPCFYGTFLWNRLRYLWPFATGWIVGLACLARVLGDLAGNARARWRTVTPLACGAICGLFVAKLEWVIDDVARSASGIDRQQVALGRWAKEHLGPDARIGVNDTGAIAYFGQRRTFDVVGLTTEGEARYWVAGAGSRFEHYERLGAAHREKLPTHFIVYPEWMAMPAVLGEPLHEAIVTDATILGGSTMRAYAADWSALGSGERPWTPVAGDPIDALDVADLDSEAAHSYDLYFAHENEQVAKLGQSPEGAAVADGGRTRRVLDRFVAKLRPGTAARGIMRLAAPSGTRVAVWAGARNVATFEVSDDEDDWIERSFDVPANVAAAHTPIEIHADGGLATTFHYWFYAATPG